MSVIDFIITDLRLPWYNDLLSATDIKDRNQSTGHQKNSEEN